MNQTRSGSILGAGDAVLAFDVGGTDTKSALIDRSGSLLVVRRTPTVRNIHDPAGAIVESIATLSRMHLDQWPLVMPAAIGVSVPGLVDERTGIVHLAASLDWQDVPMRRLVGEAIGLPVSFGHDVRAAAAAECRLGAATGARTAIVVAIGTGVAASLVIDGAPHSGDGYAGELGHSLSDPTGERCPCGAVGCLETIASASAIARRYSLKSGIRVAGAREVLHAASAGDPTARAVWAQAIQALAESLARLVAVIAPEIIVIGGGLAQAGPALLDPLRAHLDALLSFHRRPRLERAAFGENAGLIGTALLARDGAHETLHLTKTRRK
ncbi:ROK family protein [Microbacterium lacus]|uniref:ROK family protein n=1 Tax=Microbacterium lacus TaxID=415217 RepID=UPI00384E3847